MSEENNKCDYENINDYKRAFECFKQRFLIEKKSIFNLETAEEIDCNKQDADKNDCCILSKENVKYLMDNFVNNGYAGDESFIEKIKFQLITKPTKTQNKTNEELKKLQKGALEVLATAIWLWRLAPSNAKDRKSSALEVLNLTDENYTINNNFFLDGFDGFASTGIYYNTNKPFELAFIINFFDEVLELERIDKESMIEALNKIKVNEEVGKIQISTKYDNKNIACIWKDELSKKEQKDQDRSKEKVKEQESKLKNAKTEDEKNKILKSTKSVAMYNALLHLIDDTKYEPILSINHKVQIRNTFGNILKINSLHENIDKSIQQIKKQIMCLEVDIDKDSPYFFYDSKLKNIWQSGLDFESKNIILHGAPGTGKTYMTEETIKSRKIIEGNSEYELVQFHPSYGYEDFIEGIKPVGLTNGQMQFELKNGIFKQMCIEAFENLMEAQNDSSKLKTYYFIADEINRAELSRVFGELLLCLEDDKRLRIVDGKVLGTKVKTPNSNLWNNDDKYIVAKVDKKDKLNEDGEGYFGVPENIYFIGTMNDIDRSVDSFDMALRRRFVWKHYACDYDVIESHYKNLDSKEIEKYIQVCKDLNEFITSEKGFNLSDSYELGQSYFIKPKTFKNTELDRVWKEHISPILKEYLRAEYSEKEIQTHLNTASEIFKLNK